MAATPVSLHFGIGAETEDDELKAMLETSHPKHPPTMQDKVDCILAYVEQMQVTTRDNNAILHQLMRTMEDRINVKIENLRTEMIELIEKKASEQQLNSPLVGNASNKTGKPARRASVQDVKHKADKYNTNTDIPPMSPPRVEAYYEMVDINPHPGFVVKTRKLIGEKNKVFINIFHHELIALTPPGMTAEKAKDKPYMMMEAPTTTVDHAGVSCMTFNVGISSEYFQLPNPKIDINITEPATIYKLIHKVNLKFNEFLDEGNYSIPRLANGYKGESPPVFKVPQLKDDIGDHERLKVTRSMGDLPVPHPRRASDGSAPLSAQNGGGLTHSSSAPQPVKSNGIAGVWAATESAEDTISPLPGDFSNGHGVQRRGSETNDTDSVISDITTSSAQPSAHNGRVPARRSSLAMMVGLGGSANNLHDHNGAAPARKLTRKSVLINPAAAGYNGGAIAGRNLLSGDMLEYVQNENISNEDAAELKNTAAEDPAILLGWQIWFQGEGGDSNTNTIYVITDVRKNFLSKTEFRLSRFKEDDQWVKLKRQDGKSGAEFRPMRKVLFGLSADDETVV